MCLCICVSTLEGINNQWSDMGYVRLVLWLSPAFNYFMTLAIDRMDGRCHINTARHKSLSKKSKVTRY